MVLLAVIPGSQIILKVKVPFKPFNKDVGETSFRLDQLFLIYAVCSLAMKAAVFNCEP